MKNTFLLIHGAWEGAWSWEKTTKFLEEKGNRVFSIDLPGHGDDKTPIPLITMRLYVDKVKQKLANLEGPVVLVSHSFAGYVITQVAEELPEKIKKLIYIASVIPHDGKPAIQQFEEDAGSELLENLIFSEDKSYATLSKESVLNVIFTGATEAQIDKIYPKLVKQATNPFFEVVTTTDEKFGKIAKAYVEVTKDRVISLNAQRKLQKKIGITEVATLETGHVPLETKPKELAHRLNYLANVQVPVN